MEDLTLNVTVEEYSKEKADLNMKENADLFKDKITDGKGEAIEGAEQVKVEKEGK